MQTHIGFEAQELADLTSCIQQRLLQLKKDRVLAESSPLPERLHKLLHRVQIHRR